LTVSIQTVARSTEGAAGFRRERPHVINGIAATITAISAILLISFFRATSLPRGTSMEILPILVGNYSANTNPTEK
jgi:hypothetical protein